MKNKTFKLIDESYNANPLSVKEAINNLSKIKTLNNSKKYILLGDMLELGKNPGYIIGNYLNILIMQI